MLRQSDVVIAAIEARAIACSGGDESAMMGEIASLVWRGAGNATATVERETPRSLGLMNPCESQIGRSSFRRA